MATKSQLPWDSSLGYFAHSLTDRDLAKWEPLNVHLEAVATRSRDFAAAFGAAEWGYLAGLWHDLGKYQPKFQARLFGDRAQVEHAGMGAARVEQLAPDGRGWPIQFAIAGHHAGLANKTLDGHSKSLTRRLEENRSILTKLQGAIPFSTWNRELPTLPEFLIRLSKSQNQKSEFFHSFAFFTRMLFSALVDADSLETERFYGNQPLREKSVHDDVATLRDRLDLGLDNLAQAAKPTDVNRVRGRVLAQCRTAATAYPPGCFSLSVPTGGGKTLSAMSFALTHAAKHGLRRVIVAVPYTTIIEQNADVYAKFIGPKNIIEHHSNLDDFAEVENADEDAIRRRLACENWDAPIVVTTNVQFFESLFANKKSRCRKLHNIARSVIVLDEAQCLPVNFLAPVLDALRELTSNYGCSVVLCTATQPALEKRDSLPTGLTAVQEIIPDPIELASQLKRITTYWPDPSAPPTPYIEIADRLVKEPAVLAVVHRRQDAALLAQLVAERAPSQAIFHLSALMCPAHRREVVAKIRAALKSFRADGTPCRVISTQLIEAGVDVDFPVVYRALAGMDSIAQAAGRCNREGRLERGHVHLFLAETEPPGKTLQRALGKTRQMLELGPCDLSDPQLYADFFRRFYADENLDANNIRSELVELNFENVGAKFRLIEDGFQQPIIIPWDKTARQRIRALESATPFEPNRRELLRALQPYTVQVRPYDFEKLQRARVVTPLWDNTLWVLQRELFESAYSRQLGLVISEEITPSVEGFFG